MGLVWTHPYNAHLGRGSATQHTQYTRDSQKNSNYNDITLTDYTKYLETAREFAELFPDRTIDLDFSDTNMHGNHFSADAQFLDHTLPITYLDLSSNRIKWCIKYIYPFIKATTTLLTLNLSDISMERRDIKELSIALTSNRSIQILNLAHIGSGFDTDDNEEFFEYLSTTTTLNSLNLSGNYNSVHKGFVSLCECLATNTVVTQLYLRKNLVSTEKLNALEHLISTNKTLTHLEFSSSEHVFSSSISYECPMLNGIYRSLSQNNTLEVVVLALNALPESKYLQQLEEYLRSKPTLTNFMVSLSFTWNDYVVPYSIMYKINAHVLRNRLNKQRREVSLFGLLLDKFLDGDRDYVYSSIFKKRLNISNI